ncbi:MAG: DUF2460 domain-containing protein [Pseudomonadota bacterium]
MGFHDIRFPPTISFGSTGGPERRTEIVSLASGREERNSPWRHSRRRYDAGYGVRSLDDIQEIIAFFEARAGRLHAFRWRGWADWKSCAPSGSIAPTDQPLGQGDGATTRFDLIKEYPSGGETYQRPISKPDPASVRTAIDGVETTAFSLNEDLAVVFEAPPPVGSTLTAGFAFDVPARFDSDALAINLASFEAGEIPSIPIIEVLQ